MCVCVCVDVRVSLHRVVFNEVIQTSKQYMRDLTVVGCITRVH